MLRNALRRYDRRIDAWSKDLGDKYDFIPNKITMKQAKEVIGTRNQLYQYIKRLDRISRPDAGDVVTISDPLFGEYNVPKYHRNELNNLRKTKDRERRDLLYKLYPGWDEMSAMEQAKHMVDGNIAPLEGTYYTGDDIDDLVSMEYSESEFNYVTNYLSVWHEYCVVHKYEQQVVDDIMWLYESRPGALTEILARGYVQAKVEYIYEDSADMTDIYIRHHNIVEFWQDMRDNYA